MQPETRFKYKVKERLDAIENLWYEKIQQVTIRGTPDFLICYAGHFVAWELKVGKNTATNLQQYILDKITKAGGMALVVTPENLDEAIVDLLLLNTGTKPE